MCNVVVLDVVGMLVIFLLVDFSIIYSLLFSHCNERNYINIADCSSNYLRLLWKSSSLVTV